MRMLKLTFVSSVFSMTNKPAWILDGAASRWADADDNAIPMELFLASIMSLLSVSVRMSDSLGRDEVSLSTTAITNILVYPTSFSTPLELMLFSLLAVTRLFCAGIDRREDFVYMQNAYDL